jgi:subtilisin-like proprotein convertase family protein
LNNWWRYVIDVDQFKNGDGMLGPVSDIGFAQVTAPTDGATVSGMVPVSVDASADGAIGRVDLYVDGTFYESDSLAPFTFVWNTDGLLGAHILTAKAYELQSGVETVSAPVTVNVLGATISGTVQSNSVPLGGVTLTAQGSVKQWLRQTASPGAPIPDNNPGGVTNTLFIPQAGTVVDVNVGVTLRHPRRSDLRVTLVHPTGATVRLRSEGGSPERDLFTFYPELAAPLETLSNLAGLPVTGTWKLIVADVADGANGIVESWSLALNYREPQTFAAITGGDGAWLLTNLPAGDYEIRPANPGTTFLPITTNLTLSANTTNIVFVVGPNNPPVIVTPPQTQTVFAGTNLTLTVVADGTGPLSYQWFYNDTPISGATTASLSLSNLLVANGGVYSVVVSNPLPASASASATVTVLPTPFSTDLCEGNAGEWASFVPSWEGSTSSVSDDTTHVKVGSQSIRFDTTSGFDTGVKFPADAGAHWDLRRAGRLSFWAFSDNNTPIGFQGPQPVIVLDCAGGSFTLTPNDQLMANHSWTFYRIPLQGNAVWALSTNGAPDLADANQIEIHQDTWDAGFTIYYDGLQFESKPMLSPPQFVGNGQLHLFVTAPVGVLCTLQTSTNLAQWSNLSSRTTLQPQEEWLLGPAAGGCFYRVLAQ